MKNLMFILLALIAWVSVASCQRTTPGYGLSEAASHVGEDATVRGEVSAVFESRKGNYFLSIGWQCPNQLFPAVIFKSNASSDFNDPEGFEGKTIEVTGKIKSYQGKSEIILNGPSQVKVVK